MNNSQFKRLIKLVKRTGDKLVVFDENDSAASVLMPLDQYEDLLGPDFGDDFDPNDLPPFDFGNGRDEIKLDSDDEDDEDNYYNDDDEEENEFTVWDEERHPWDDAREDRFSRNSLDWGDNDFDESDQRTIQQIAEEERMKAVDEEMSSVPSVLDTAPEESLADVPHEEEEEKFYLEPVE